MPRGFELHYGPCGTLRDVPSQYARPCMAFVARDAKQILGVEE